MANEVVADDLRSTLEAAVSAAETSHSEGTPMPETVAPAAKETFDAATGKPVEESKPLESKSENPTGKTPPEVTETPLDEQGEPAPKVDKAPQSWKPSTKAKWDKLDPDIRSEVMRREKETTRVLNESSGAKKFVTGFQQAAAPYESRWRAMNVSPAQAVTALMANDYALSQGGKEAAKLMASMIKDYKIDVNELDDALSGAIGQRPDPESIIDQRIQQALAPFVQERQQTQAQRESQQQREFQATAQAVERMSEDPKMPMFDLVRMDMADIIDNNLRRGVTVSAEEAYTRAVRMNPEAYAESQKTTKLVGAQGQHQAAQRSLGASLSVSGSPSALSTPVPASDLRGTIEAAFLANQGR